MKENTGAGKMVDTGGDWPQASGQYENFSADVLVQALGQNVDTDPFDKNRRYGH